MRRPTRDGRLFGDRVHSQTNTKSMREKKQKCLKQVRRLSLISPKKYIMPDSIFEQPFVYCGVCHRRTSHGDPLRLTSCAHILCSQHSPLTSKVCPICRSSDISIINLVESKQLPTDIRIFLSHCPHFWSRYIMFPNSN